MLAIIHITPLPNLKRILKSSPLKKNSMLTSKMLYFYGEIRESVKYTMH